MVIHTDDPLLQLSAVAEIQIARRSSPASSAKASGNETAPVAASAPVSFRTIRVGAA